MWVRVLALGCAAEVCGALRVAPRVLRPRIMVRSRRGSSWPHERPRSGPPDGRRGRLKAWFCTQRRSAFLRDLERRGGAAQFLAAAATIRLDEPLIRKSSFVDRALPGLAASAAIAAAAALAALAFALLFGFVESVRTRSSAASGEKPRAAPSTTNNDAASAVSFSSSEEEALGDAEGGLSARLKNFARRRAGGVAALRDAVTMAYQDVVGPRGTVLPADKPALCNIDDIDEFGDGAGACSVYRFRLTAGPQSLLDLDLGQLVEVAVLDDKNRMVRASFPIASSRFDPGFVEVVAPAPQRRLARLRVGALTAQQRAVVDALDLRGLGGDVAVKPGPRMFEYQGAYVPITALRCFVEDTGALPVIQLLKESLPRGRSTVKTSDVFWINSSEDEFALYSALEALFYKFSNKVRINCLVDEDLHDQETDETLFTRNDDLRDAVQTWTPGTLALVAGPQNFMATVTDHLTTQLKYPAECVIRLVEG